MRTFFVLSLIPALLSGQIADDFSGGYLSWQYSWEGDTSEFSITPDHMLQLQSDSEGQAFIYLTHAIWDSTQWEIWFWLDFSPSGSNKLRFYLALDTADVSFATGYFFELGESGNEDALQFFALNDGQEELLALTGTGKLSTEPVKARFLANRITGKGWEFCLKFKEDTPWLDCVFVEEYTEAPDTCIFGISCHFTASRNDKFFFDDLLIQPLTPDTSGPDCTRLEVVDSATLLLTFDEIVDSGSVSVTVFQLDQITPELKAVFLTDNQYQALLIYDQSFSNFTTYCLEISGIKDLTGNLSQPQDLCFEFILPEPALPFEILITEIMADPHPPLGLPPVEYLELYNNSGKAIQLADYLLVANNRQIPLPETLMHPETFLIVCGPEGIDAMAGFGAASVVNDFPNLSNSGMLIGIRDSDGRDIHFIEYSSDWYHDSYKSGGGWSLEMIDPGAACLQAENWTASNDLRGGTPGIINSVIGKLTIEDHDLSMLSVLPVSENEIVLEFNYIIWQDPGVFEISIQPHREIDTVLIFLNTLRLTFVDHLLTDTEYTLQIDGLKDCLGEGVKDAAEVHFALPVLPEPGEIIVNEILYEPYSGGDRFVELYNSSGKYFLSTDLIIGEVDSASQKLYSVKDSMLIVPGMRLVFTEDAATLDNFYPVERQEWILASDLPSWGSKGGQITLLRNDGLELEAFTFDEGLHHPLIDNTRGISLERVSPLADPGQRSSWQSCASSAGYATPTGMNSQNRTGTSHAEIAVENPIFSPDGDGYRDVLLIDFGPEMQNYVANLRVFDLAGYEVKRILENEVLSFQLTVHWDGTDNQSVAMPVGKYILWIECFHPDGNRFVRKAVCTLAARL